MKDQLLWIDAMFRLSLGGLLLLFPSTTITALGLPKPAGTFWPRMLAVLLIGLAAASILHGFVPAAQGFGLGGAFVLNVATGLAVLTALVVGQLEVPGRGRLTLWVSFLLLLVLCLVQLAWI
jgi:hypothetical protein